jgi:hypothetical protein
MLRREEWRRTSERRKAMVISSWARNTNYLVSNTVEVLGEE